MSREHWNWMASRYERLYRLNSTRSQRIIKDRALMMIMPGKVLEVGAGTGIYTKYFCETESKITAIDFSPNMLNLAKLRNLKATLLLEDATNTSFSDKSFDGAVGCYILQWIDHDLLFKELHRVIRPGGRIAFLTDNIYNPVVIVLRLINYIDSLFRNGVHPKLVQRSKLSKVLLKNGFYSIKYSVLGLGATLLVTAIRNDL